MKRALLAAVPVLSWLAFPAAAEMFGAEYRPCGEQANTMQIVACLEARTRVWDQRLNTAYQALQQRIDAGQRAPLLAAQRLWIQYRDANCRFYAAQDGTIRLIQAAECARAMTEARAVELERAMKFD